MNKLSRAIMHIDMDAFFASVAQQQEAIYKGKPVVTGSERAIATSVSYEAKALGIKRCIPIHEIKKRFPEVCILPSDYETIGLFSRRIFEIVRNYSEEVEEYSVDECFADITGLEEAWGMTYEDIARSIQRDIQVMLGATGSIGLAQTKTLAKIASKWKKPHGFTVIYENEITLFLAKVSLREIWGIGGAYERFLGSAGMKTALDFVQKPHGWIKDNLAKPGQELWQELQGKMVHRVHAEQRQHQQSIARHKTFWPHTSKRSELLIHLAKNVENACAQLRKEGLVTAHAVFGLKREDFSYRIREIEIASPGSTPQHFIASIQKNFEKIYRADVKYRATFFNLYGLHFPRKQSSLFDKENVLMTKQEEVYAAVDRVNKKFGKHTVHLGASLRSAEKVQKEVKKQSIPWRKQKENWLPGETEQKKVNIPYCGWAR